MSSAVMTLSQQNVSSVNWSMVATNSTWSPDNVVRLALDSAAVAAAAGSVEAARYVTELTDGNRPKHVVAYKYIMNILPIIAHKKIDCTALIRYCLTIGLVHFVNNLFFTISFKMFFSM